MKELLPDNPLGIAAWSPNGPVDYSSFFEQTPENGELWIHDTAIPNLRGKKRTLENLLRKNVKIKATLIHPYSYCCYARSQEMVEIYNNDEGTREELHFTLADFRYVLYENIVCYKSLFDYSQEIGSGSVELYLYSSLPSMPIYISLNKRGTGKIFYSHFLNTATDYSYYILLEYDEQKRNSLWKNMHAWVSQKIKNSQNVDLNDFQVDRQTSKTPSLEVLHEIDSKYRITDGGEFLVRSSYSMENQVTNISGKKLEVLKAIAKYPNPKGNYKLIAGKIGMDNKVFYNYVAQLKDILSLKGRAEPEDIIKKARMMGIIE